MLDVRSVSTEEQEILVALEYLATQTQDPELGALGIISLRLCTALVVKGKSKSAISDEGSFGADCTAFLSSLSYLSNEAQRSGLKGLNEIIKASSALCRMVSAID